MSFDYKGARRALSGKMGTFSTLTEVVVVRIYSCVKTLCCSLDVLSDAKPKTREI